MSLLDPQQLEQSPDLIEELERASARFVSHAMHTIVDLAESEFRAVLAGLQPSTPTPTGTSVTDAADYLGEDLTRLALDTIGASRVPGARLFGAIDYKMAVLQFLPGFAVEQALLVDSKAEKGSLNNCRVQVTQTSLEIRQTVSGTDIAIPGRVDPIWVSGTHKYLTSTLFVKYHYGNAGLTQITVAALPHKFLQDRYNPNAANNIWNVGPNAPTLNESFRTRLNFQKLETLASWRVQRIIPGRPWSFVE